jgi:hypothetical protein
MTDLTPDAAPVRASIPEKAPGKPKPSGSGMWRWNVGLVIFLMMIIPSSVMVILYYREVAATYYVTRNPLPKSARDMAGDVGRMMIDDIKDAMALGKSVSSEVMSGSPDRIHEALGKYVQSGHLGHFGGWSVYDRKAKAIGGFESQTLRPYQKEADALVGRLRTEGGPALISRPIFNAGNRLVLLLLAVPVLRPGQTSDARPQGYLVGIENFSGTFGPYLFRPKQKGAPGLSYIASSGGHILASSNSILVGQDMKEIGLGAVLDRFRQGRSGGFKDSVKGENYLFGSALLADLQGITDHSWIVVLQAPEDVVMVKARRMRFIMDLVAFVVAPILFCVDCYFLFRSLRSST